MKRIPRSFLIVFGIASVAAPTAMGQATITRSFRSVDANVWTEDVGDQESVDHAETGELGYFAHNASAIGAGIDTATHQSEAQLASFVDPQLITGSVFVDSTGGEMGGDFFGAVYAGAQVEFEVEFTIATPTKFTFDYHYETADGGPVIPFVFYLNYQNERLFDYYDEIDLEPYGDHVGTVSHAGIFEPGEYKLRARVSPSEYLFHGGMSFIKPNSLDFTLQISGVPAPSSLAAVAIPALILSKRRRG